MIRFGPWSTTLGLATAFGLTVSLLLLTAGGFRPANRLLAALLAGAALKLMPYVLGYAGFYTAYPWLSFAPFDFGLAFGPLLFLYVKAMTSRRLPPRWGWHFAPLAIDLSYTCWAFTLPFADKMAWNDQVHAPFIDPVETWLTFVSLLAYLVLAWRAFIAIRPAAGDRRRRRWLLTTLAALSVWLGVSVAFHVVELSLGLNYLQRFPEYLVFAVLVLVLGLEGWRNAEALAPPEPTRDWRQIGSNWLDAIREAGWWREAGLSLADVARRLGTNDTYLSRAMNDGLGMTFAAAINRLRVEAVQRRLREAEPGDILGIALDSGFASKPSFNRVFRDIAGTSPSQWRRLNGSQPRNPAIETTRTG